MNMTIEITLPESLAKVYETASLEEKQKAQWLIELVLNDLLLPSSGSLLDTVKTISTRAAQRGLTPEILDDLLKDDE